MASPLRKSILPALGLLTLALLLAWISGYFSGLAGWPSFLALLALAAGLGWLAWRLLQREEPPRWLLWLTLGAILLRLLLGAFWFLSLPIAGYNNPVNDAGYVMEDAYNRDLAAWDLAQSEQPLADAFRGFSFRDQYGGLLYLSAAIYRYLGGAQHLPLLMIVLAAAASGLAVALTWAFARRLWGDKPAVWVAWGLALYPEAALLGSSQMREAFSVTLAALLIYAFLRWKESRAPADLALVALPVALAIPLSYPVALALLAFAGLLWLAADDWRLLRHPVVWIGLLAAGILGAIWLFTQSDIGQTWLVQSAGWQSYVSENASGWVARQFERMPAWSQVPFIVAYGVVRPLLPAALVAESSAPIWKAIIIWRALGWTALLALLLYASFLALRNQAWKRLPGALLLANWFIILVASYRGGGDDWDSPRYRSAFAAIQLALAAWALWRQQEQRDPWLRRALVGTILVVAWFIPWYLRRYAAFDWPIVELHQVVGLGLASAALYIFWDWLALDA